jgi:hypothetical protein
MLEREVEVIVCEEEACDNIAMSLSELKSQLAHLELKERQELKAYLEELEADGWDAQIEADAKAGRLDFLLEQVKAEIRAGHSQPINGSLRDAYETYQRSLSKK